MKWKNNSSLPWFSKDETPQEIQLNTINQLFSTPNENFKRCYSSLRKSRGASYNIRTYRLDKRFVAYFVSRTCGHSIYFSKKHFKLILSCFHGVSLLKRYKNDHWQWELVLIQPPKTLGQGEYPWNTSGRGLLRGFGALSYLRPRNYLEIGYWTILDIRYLRKFALCF